LARPKGLVVQEDLIAQEFNLEEILGVDLSGDETLAAEIGQDIVQFIQDRAESGKGIGGKVLRSPYSKPYSKTTEFELAGKSISDVNMRLTGDMLGSIEVLDFDGSVLTVGIENDQAPKAHGHMTGKNGESPNMKREFFGLTQSELKDILANYDDRIGELKDRPQRVEDFLTADDNRAIDQLFRNAGDVFSFGADDEL
jgi:hypothetical protein